MATILTRPFADAMSLFDEVATSDPLRAAATATPLRDVIGDLQLTRHSVFASLRLQLVAAYSFIGVHACVRLALPLLLGLAINDLLKSAYRGLLTFAGVYLISMIVGVISRMYEARIVAKTHTELAVDDERRRQFSERNAQAGCRTHQVGRISEFFNRGMWLQMETGITLAGSMLLLGWNDAALVPICLLTLLPAVLLNAAWGQKIVLLKLRLAANCDASDMGDVRARCELLGRWQTQLADATAVRCALLQLFSLGLLATTLVHYCTSAISTAGTVSAGDMVAVSGYLLIFVNSLKSAAASDPVVSR